MDLAGWTGNALPELFASKIAPVQVNYLGFFASTGLPEMNFWLGDHSLFPDSTNEWSTEQLWHGLNAVSLLGSLLMSCLKVVWLFLRALQEMMLFSEVSTMSVSLVIQLSASGVEF